MVSCSNKKKEHSMSRICRMPSLDYWWIAGSQVIFTYYQKEPDIKELQYLHSLAIFSTLKLLTPSFTVKLSSKAVPRLNKWVMYWPRHNQSALTRPYISKTGDLALSKAFDQHWVTCLHADYLLSINSNTFYNQHFPSQCVVPSVI